MTTKQAAQQTTLAAIELTRLTINDAYKEGFALDDEALLRRALLSLDKARTYIERMHGI